VQAEYSTYSNAGSLDHGSKNDRMAEISPALADYLFRDRAAEVPTIDPLAGEIQHAPILSEEVVKTNSVTLQQFGPLGVHVDSGTKLFQNTNVPFATFVCGVQGSGKSHTTACMLGKLSKINTAPIMVLTK
jgi:signal recognition particle GTPase